MKKEKNAEGKMRAAEYLFSEIGEIDESLIAAASPEVQVTYEYIYHMGKRTDAGTDKVRKKNGFSRRAIAIAAAVAVFVISVPVLFVIANMSNNKESKLAQDETGQDDVLYFEPETMLEVLNQAAKLNYGIETDKESIDLYDGAFKIIWTFDESEYFIAQINTKDANNLLQLTKDIAKTSGNITSGDDDNEAYIWLNDGKGRVFSPMLEYTKGNTYIGEIYLYSPEIQPDADYLEYIYDLISKS